MNTNTKLIVDLFKAAAMDHVNINWFDYSTAEFIFNSQTNLEYPCIFLQLIDSLVTDGTREELNFTVYSLQARPDNYEYKKGDDNYAYDEQVTDERDLAFDTLRDVINKVRLQNRRTMMINQGTTVFDNDTFSGAVGWRQTINIVTQATYNVGTDFPEITE